ncbi:hypothetical protein [Nonomuraea dietziae]|uniref:alpha/beta hydrolase n=1 Tax=Nonomuraea dietziae TaxID=65515 RepID=UPI0034346691
MLAVVASASCVSAPPAFSASSSGQASAAGSTAPGAPSLPEPSGSHPVGTTSLHLKDGSRRDPWVPTVKARELMVSLWYPAKSRGKRRAQYMTPKESEVFLKGGRITGVPYDVLSRTRTHAFTDVEPAGRRRGLPLVVLSPGFTQPRGTLTALAEDLASRGYVVAGIDHTYESFATFPGGRMTMCAACAVGKDKDFGGKVVGVRAADVSFVLDELTGHARGGRARL